MKLYGLGLILGLFAYANQSIHNYLRFDNVLLETDPEVGPDDVYDEYDNSRGRGGSSIPFSISGDSEPSGFNESGSRGGSVDTTLDWGSAAGGYGGDFY